jgi:hypothetical protein
LLDGLGLNDLWTGDRRGCHIAVVDSGIDNDHPAIAGAVKGWCEPHETSGAFEFRDGACR